MSDRHVRILDLGHGLLFVREAQDVEIGIRDHDVLGLAADPAAHVDITVGGTGTGRVDIQADPGFPFLAIAATPTRDVEGHRDEVTNLHKLNVPACFHDLTGDLVTEYEARRCGGTAPNHVLVAPANIGAHNPEDHTVVTTTVPESKYREIDRLELDLSGGDVRNALVAPHASPFPVRRPLPLYCRTQRPARVLATGATRALGAQPRRCSASELVAVRARKIA